MNTIIPAEGERVLPSKTLVWQGWLILNLFAVVQFVIQGSTAILAQSLEADLQLNVAQLSLLSSSFFYSYIFMQIPVGLLYDRFGIQKMACFGIFGLFFCLVLYSQATSWPEAVFIRVMMGFFSSFGFLGLLIGVQRWFEVKHFAFIVAVSDCFGMAGTALVNQGLSSAVEHFFWRYVVLGAALFILILAISARVFLSQIEQDIEKKARGIVAIPLEHEGLRSLIHRVLKQLKSLLIWKAGFVGGSGFIVITVFAALWGVPFLIAKYGYSLSQATSVVSTVYLGIAVASPVIGYLAGKIPIAVLISSGLLVGTVLMSMILLIDMDSRSLLFFMFLMGVFVSVYQLVFAFVSERVSVSSQGIAMGLTNMVMILLAPVVQPIIGYSLSSRSFDLSDTTNSVVGVSTIAHYQSVLMIIPLVMFLGWVVSLALFDYRPSFLSPLSLKCRRYIKKTVKMKKKTEDDGPD